MYFKSSTRRFIASLIAPILFLPGMAHGDAGRSRLLRQHRCGSMRNPPLNTLGGAWHCAILRCRC